MKNKVLPTLLGIGLLIGATVLPGYGQTTGQRSDLAVDIPFDFVIAGITLPLGQYKLSATSDRVLRVQGADGKNHALVLTRPLSGHQSDTFGHVLFNCYGDRCFLSQVWAAEHELGLELMMCPAEKRLAKRPAGPHVALLSAKSGS